MISILFLYTSISIFFEILLTAAEKKKKLLSQTFTGREKWLIDRCYLQTDFLKQKIQKLNKRCMLKQFILKCINIKKDESAYISLHIPVLIIF